MPPITPIVFMGTPPSAAWPDVAAEGIRPFEASPRTRGRVRNRGNEGAKRGCCDRIMFMVSSLAQGSTTSGATCIDPGQGIERDLSSGHCLSQGDGEEVRRWFLEGRLCAAGAA